MEASSTTNDSNQSTDTTTICSNDLFPTTSENSYKEAILTCAFCKNMVDEPLKTKLLPCLHSLCCTCEINEIIEGKITCHICNQSCMSNEIMDHFLVQHVDENAKVLKCNNCTDNAIAKFKCTECEDFLCLECSQAHKRVKVTKEHQLTEVEDVAYVAIDVKCTIHKTEDLLWFCLTCDKVTCRNCQLENHAGHQYHSLEEQENLYKSQMKKLLEDNTSKIPYIVQVAAVANQRAQEVTNSENTMRSELMKSLNQVKQALEDRGKFLLHEIEKISEEKRQSYLEIKMTAEKIESMSKQINLFAEAAIESSSSKLAIYNSVKAIRNSLKNVEKLKEQSRPPPVNISQIVQLSLHFPIDEFLLMIRQMGDLIIDRAPQSVPPTNFYLNAHQHHPGMIGHNNCNEFYCCGPPFPQIRPGLRLDPHVPYYEPHVHANLNFRPMLPVSHFGPQWRTPPQSVNLQYSPTTNSKPAVFEMNHSPRNLNPCIPSPVQRQPCPNATSCAKMPNTLQQPMYNTICPPPPPLQYGPRCATSVEVLDQNHTRKRRLENSGETNFDQTLPDIEANLHSSKLHETNKISHNSFLNEIPIVHLPPTVTNRCILNSESSAQHHIINRKLIDTKPKDEKVEFMENMKNDQSFSFTSQNGIRLAKKSITRAFDKDQN